MTDFKVIQEELKVFGNQLVDQVRQLLHETNVRRIIVKDQQGHTYMEVPVGIVAVGAILAPVLAAVGAIAAMAANFQIVVERVETPPPQQPQSEPPKEPPAGSAQ